MFQIVKTLTGYADTPLTLLSFDGNNGWGPEDGLIIDGNGNLFATTSSGGGHDLGTVFEIVKMPRAGYASTPNTLVSFDSWDEARPSGNGQYPSGSLIATLNGNLFGTTLSGGANHYGTVFEITGSGFAPFIVNGDILWQNDNGQAAIWLMHGLNPIAETGVGANPSPSWHVKEAGDFNYDGSSDILWQNDNGQAAIWLMNGASPLDQSTIDLPQGPDWT